MSWNLIGAQRPPVRSPSGTGSVRREGGTYVVEPRETPPVRVGPDVALEVDVVALLDVVGVEGAPQAQGHYRRV